MSAFNDGVVSNIITKGRDTTFDGVFAASQPGEHVFLPGGILVGTSFSDGVFAFDVLDGTSLGSVGECAQPNYLTMLANDVVVVQCQGEVQLIRVRRSGLDVLGRLPGIVGQPGPLGNLLPGSNTPSIVVTDLNPPGVVDLNFVQDTFTPGNFRVNVGLRFDLQDEPQTANLTRAWDMAVIPRVGFVLTYPSQGAAATFSLNGCQPAPTRACVRGDRFAVEVDWQDFAGSTGPGQVVAGGSGDSGLFWFFEPENWEMLFKVLDGCGVNGNFWVFAAAVTNVGYDLRVTDTATGAVREYANPLGRAADATTDVSAFSCDAGSQARQPRPGEDRTTASSSLVATSLPASTCADTDSALCLNRSRFEVSVEWRDFGNHRGSGQVVPLRSADSGLFWFFDAENWEMLVKVLDGCGVNGHFWVFAAATTNVEYTLRVTDTATGQMREYPNALGQAAPALTDTGAFSCGP